MKKLLSIMALALLASASSAFAGELDSEEQVKNAERLAADLPQTLVVRVNEKDGSVAVLHSKEKLPAGVEAKFEDAQFQVVANNTPPQNELDRDSSASGWYFYWNYNYSYNYGFNGYPYYYYYGYNYQYSQYYSYYNAYNYYRYYYYGYSGYGYGYGGYGYGGYPYGGWYY